MNILIFTIGYIFSLLVIKEKRPEPNPAFNVVFNVSSTTENHATAHSAASASEDIIPEGSVHQSPFLSCKNLYGKHLKRCMSCLSLEEFQSTLLGMNNRKRNYYYQLLTNKERIHLKKEFQEEQWNELTNKDPEFTKKIDRIIEAYKRAQESFFW